MPILGIDPGFASLGTALLSGINRGEGHLSPFFTGVDICRTQKNKNKVLRWDDNVARCRKIHSYLTRIVEYNDIYLIAVEAESWTRTASDKQLGLARGVIYSIAAARDIPLIQITSTDVKHFLCGKRNASKGDVLEALSARTNLEKELAYLPRGQWQHAADAAGCALHAWECSELARLYRRAREQTT